ncbi:MAG: ribbon-helix-helix domain-containing protein [Patescibacteria group bacterium]
MSVVNFTVTKPLEKKIKETIKTHGFNSKAEFFRFAALAYIQHFGTGGEEKKILADLRESQKEFALGKGMRLRTVDDLD